ncbi:fibronectin type III domain-containing protein [Chloroflexota bacterium]
MVKKMAFFDGRGGRHRSKTRTLLGILVIVSILVALLPSSSVLAVPQIPMQLYGNVTVGGSAAPDGLQVEARIGGTTYLDSTTRDGSYGYFDPFFIVPADDPDTPGKEGGVAGETVVLYVAGQMAADAEFVNGGSVELDLEVASAPSPSAPANLVRTTPAGDNTPTFTWDTPVQAPAGVASYQVKMNDGDWDDVGDVKTYTHTTALADNSHTFQVRAIDLLGSAGASASLVFSIDTTAPAVTVTSPNGGEMWAGASSHDITWSANGADLGPAPITLEYYDGSNWVTIATEEANDGTYAWSVPGLDISTARVRVTATDLDGNSASDESDAAFTIDTAPPAVTVTSPNGGEYWAGGSSHDITWSAVDANFGPTPVTLEYYDGSDWVEIATGEANDGSYAWTVPGLNISTASVRVTADDLVGHSGSDESDADFTIDSINPSITVTSPNGGESWAGGSSHDITWSASDDNFGDTPITIEYYNGSGWITVATGEANDGSYTWTVPEISISTARVRITATDLAGNTGTDESDADFAIVTAAVVTVTSPNGGEYWAGGSTREITWWADDTGLGVTPITIDYFDGSVWVPLAINEPNDGSYTWAVPELNISTARVRVTVTNLAEESFSDESDADFTIDSIDPTITLTGPNGGEYWAGGSSQYITWSATDANFGATPITIEYYDGSNWVTMAADEANDGSYTWTVAELNISTARVRVTATDLAGKAAGDESDADFTIDSLDPAVTLTGPNGGQYWAGGSSHDITWSAIDANLVASPIAIEYYNGSAWVSIADGQANDGNYNWTVPDLNVSNARIRVKATDLVGHVGSDDSDADFTIDSLDPSVTLTSPTGGELWRGEVSHDITWTTIDVNKNKVDILYSTNAGAAWNLIESGLSDTGSYSWAVPGLDTSQARVKVVATDKAGNTDSDESSANFTIDSTLPAISNVDAVDINTTTATVIWDTSEPATSQVEYGVTTDYGLTTPLDTALTQGHGVNLPGLAPGTTYHYRVISRDAVGNETTSDDNTFATNPVDVTITFSDVEASNVTTSSATIRWTTSEPATGQVEYGLTATYGLISALYTAEVTGHTITLTGLTPGTTYHYRVKSDGAVSVDYSFTTQDDTVDPTISAVASSVIGPSTAIVSWRTNELATSQVVYSTTSHAGESYPDGAAARAAYGIWSSEDTTLVLVHGVGLAGLLPDTTYYYRVISKDAADNPTVSGEYSLVTPEDTDPPDISGVMAAGITTSSVVISWNTDEPATSQVVYDDDSHIGGVPEDYEWNTIVNPALLLSRSVGLAGLAPNTTYYYRVISRDAADIETVSDEYSFVTLQDTTDPVISDVTVSNVGGSSAIILWVTNENATTNVEYGTTLGGPYPDSAPSPADTTADNTNHGLALGGLVSDTTYYFRVVSTDAYENEAVSGEYNFTTEDKTPPAIKDVSTVIALSNAAVIVWVTDEHATTQVVYSTTSHSGDVYADAAAARAAYGSWSVEDANLFQSHGVVVSGLTSGTTYYYRVISRDAAGNESISGEYSFVTA